MPAGAACLKGSALAWLCSPGRGSHAPHRLPGIKHASRGGCRRLHGRSAQRGRAGVRACDPSPVHCRTCVADLSERSVRSWTDGRATRRSERSCARAAGNPGHRPVRPEEGRKRWGRRLRTSAIAGKRSSVASGNKRPSAPKRAVPTPAIRRRDSQCSRNTPSTALISAGLISLECATVTVCSAPSIDFCQKRRNPFSSGKCGHRS